MAPLRGVARGARIGGHAALVTVTQALVALPAHAHGNTNLGDFYQGVLQPVFHLEFLLAALVLALWSTQQESRASLVTCAGFAAGVAAGAAAALFGAGGAGSIWGPRLCMLVAGPMVAARVRLPAAACAGLGVAAGIAQGHAATQGELAQIARPWLWTLGLASGVGLLGAYANAVTDRFRAFWVQVGVRIVGSWIAAVGLLASVLALR